MLSLLLLLVPHFPTGEEEQPNAAGLRFYEDFIDELPHYGIEPVVTICHFDIPLALVEKYGSCRNRKVIDCYIKYCNVIFQKFKGKVRYWITLNALYDRYQKPLFIVENGLGAVDTLTEDGTINDDYCIDYPCAHICVMMDTVDEDGVDLLGYTIWGCINLVSATTGEILKTR